MAHYRETPCKYYVAYGECKKNREACQTGYCQRCDKYEPRARVRHLNRKKQTLDRIKQKEVWA